MILNTYREFYKIVKENMSSQVPHNGMYKAAAQHPLLGCIFYKKSLKFHTYQNTLSYNTVQSPMSCYRKETYLWDVNDIHTIVLLGSEVRHTYKRIIRESMISVIYHGQIASEQYIRPQPSFLTHGIKRILVFDYQ